MPPRLISRALFLVLVFEAQSAAQTQTYCAMYNDGSKGCGIPSLQSCEQSVGGVGGYCAPDLTSQMRPDLFGGLRSPQPAPTNQTNPQDPNWMPPPPGQ
jgi:hypothetical protein